MYPSEWPQWLRDSIPGWIVIGALAWFSLQRYLDFRTTKRQAPVTYGRPVRDLRVLCPLVGISVASVVSLINEPAQGGTAAALYGLSAVFITGSVLTIVAAFIRSEWWSIGCELAGAILLGGAFLVDAIGYLDVHSEAALLSAVLVFSYVVANLGRVLQLLKRLG